MTIQDKTINLHFIFMVHPSAEKSKNLWLEKMFNLIEKNLNKARFRVLPYQISQDHTLGHHILKIEILTQLKKNQNIDIKLIASLNSKFLGQTIWVWSKKIPCETDKFTIPVLERWINELSLSFIEDANDILE